MKRRSAIVALVGFLAGCSAEDPAGETTREGSDDDSSSNSSDGNTTTEEVVVDEMVFGSGAWFNIDLEEGQSVTMEVDNQRGYATFVYGVDPDDEQIPDEEVRTQSSIDYEAELTGVYSFGFSVDERAHVRIIVHS